MDFFNVVNSRHSYRGKFKDEALDKENIRKIVQAGLEAPSGCNSQSTRFVIVDDPKKIEELKNIEGGNLAFKTAQAYIVVVIDRNPAPVYGDMSFQVEDASAAVQNILLAATAFGYASVWIDGWLRVNQTAEKIAEILAIPDDKQVRILLPLGIPEEEFNPPMKKVFEERVSYNSYSL